MTTTTNNEQQTSKPPCETCRILRRLALLFILLWLVVAFGGHLFLP